MGFWSWWFRLFGRGDALAREDVQFAARRDAMLSLYVSDALYADLRKAAGGRDVSRFVRACLKLGLGIFQSQPELVQALDTRGGQQRHITLWADQQTLNRVLTVSGNQQSRLIRASIEIGIPVFSAHPDLISILEPTGKE